MSNTNSTTSWRARWFSTMLAETLKNALVAEKICDVDRSGAKYIWNPYGSKPTITIQSLAGGNQGTYTPETYTSTDDTLTVTDEFICSEQIYDFERVMQNGDIMMSRQEEIIAWLAIAIDKFVVNNLGTTAGGTYPTPVGGFATGANVNQICADLWGLVSGYADTYKGVYLVVESTDVPGFVLAGASSGFSFADSWLNNGFLTSYMGIDIYVLRAGTFVTGSLGSTTVSMSGHRLFGVKGVSTYAEPQDITWEEKGVTGKTGKECVAVCYCGFNAWHQKLNLTVNITLN